FSDKIVDHSNAITATDSYHRYKDDVKMLRNMGMDAYSFSISWSRVIPRKIDILSSFSSI
nr:beta-glucosidase 12-like [Tanacetum cinerariifolium]